MINYTRSAITMLLSILTALMVFWGCDSSDSPTSDFPTSEGSNPSGANKLPHFSFFVTSLKSLQELSGNPLGFGGDLRYGETGPGAGLRGADKICEEIAEMSMPGSSVKEWRAFLSVSADKNGQQVDAIDRIGEGPWYDRLGRLVASTKADLLHDRPQNGHIALQNDLPNEWGVPNHQPDPTLPPVKDNHHTLTGSTENGTLYPPRCPAGDYMKCVNECIESGGEHMTYECPLCDLEELCRMGCLGPEGDVECDDPMSSTCQDWTTSDGSPSNGRPRIGFSWPRVGRDFGQNWISMFNAPGCAPVGSGSPAVGQPGSYGGFYCFALNP